MRAGAEGGGGDSESAVVEDAGDHDAASGQNEGSASACGGGHHDAAKDDTVGDNTSTRSRVDYYLLSRKKELFPGAAATKSSSNLKKSFSSSQDARLKALWEKRDAKFVGMNFCPSPTDQDEAKKILREAGVSLDRLVPQGKGVYETRDGVKWGVMNSRVPRGSEDTWDVVLRCLCCRDESAALPGCSQGDGRHSFATTRRNTAHDCSAFAEICVAKGRTLQSTSWVENAEFDENTLEIRQIRGYMGHSEGCVADKESTRPTNLKLHPELVHVLEHSVQNGCSRLQLNMNIREASNSIREKIPASENGSFRFSLNNRDIRAVQEALLKAKLGVDIGNGKTAEVNLDDFFGPKGEAIIKESTFIYQPETKDQRFMLGIMTPQMADAAREHCHDGVLFVDGTFGLSKQKTLVFILMTTDASGNGVPIGILLFTGKRNALNAAASYDSMTLQKLFEVWAHKAACGANGKNVLGCNKITPLVAMTDADTTEKSAIRTVWPGITTLTCVFHCFQAWRRKIPKHLGTGGNAHQKSARRAVVSALRVMQRKLVEEPMSESDQLATIRQLSESYARKAELTEKGWRKKLYLGAVSYLNVYFIPTCFSFGRVEEWTPTGRDKGAARLSRARPGRDGKGNCVPTTNNIVESLNSWLKIVGLAHFKNRGRLLRLDVLVSALVKVLLPYLEERDDAKSRQNELEKTHYSHWAAANPKEAAKANERHAADLSQQQELEGKFSFCGKDKERDKKSKAIVKKKLISQTSLPGDLLHILTVSSEDISGSTYKVTIHLNRVCDSTCDCLDFKSVARRRSFCKHIRAGLLYLDVPMSSIPRTTGQARAQSLRLGSAGSADGTSVEQQANATSQTDDVLLAEFLQTDVEEQAEGTRYGTEDAAAAGALQLLDAERVFGDENCLDHQDEDDLLEFENSQPFAIPPPSDDSDSSSADDANDEQLHEASFATLSESQRGSSSTQDAYAAIFQKQQQLCDARHTQRGSRSLLQQDFQQFQSALHTASHMADSMDQHLKNLRDRQKQVEELQIALQKLRAGHNLPQDKKDAQLVKEDDIEALIRQSSHAISSLMIGGEGSIGLKATGDITGSVLARVDALASPSRRNENEGKPIASSDLTRLEVQNHAKRKRGAGD